MFQKFFSICLVLLVAQAIHAQNNVLYGTVNDSENNVGLADASIVAAGTGKVAVTDTRGYYRMENIPAGTYSFIVSKAGYLPTDLYINVTANTETKLQFSLQKDPAAISNSTLSDIPTITMEEAEAETDLPDGDPARGELARREEDHVGLGVDGQPDDPVDGERGRQRQP